MKDDAKNSSGARGGPSTVPTSFGARATSYPKPGPGRPRKRPTQAAAPQPVGEDESGPGAEGDRVEDEKTNKGQRPSS